MKATGQIRVTSLQSRGDHGVLLRLRRNVAHRRHERNLHNRRFSIATAATAAGHHYPSPGPTLEPKVKVVDVQYRRAEKCF